MKDAEQHLCPYTCYLSVQLQYVRHKADCHDFEALILKKMEFHQMPSRGAHHVARLSSAKDTRAGEETWFKPAWELPYSQSGA